MNDRFVRDNTLTYAGIHIIIDAWQASNLINTDFVEQVIKQAAEKTGAEIISSKFHSFGENEGCTGIILLSESHMSIHTWPEQDYAAIDVFTCGETNPRLSLDVVKEKFETDCLQIQELTRGLKFDK